MYKLIIVDDEKEIREGLAAFAWDSLGIEMNGMFGHGLDALHYAAEHPVDIVLTDIRMPFMDGVELMELLNKRHPYIKVVVLSGYNDFDYAKKAIQNGAVDYLLKPTQFAPLADTFRRLIAKLDAEKQEELRKSALERKGLLLAKMLRDDFLQRLFQFELAPEEIEQGCAEGELLLEGRQFSVIMLELDRMTMAETEAPVPDKELRLITFSLDNILQDLWEGSGNGYHVVDKETAVCYLLSLCSNREEQAAQVKEQLSRFMGLFKSTISAGVGIGVEQLSDIWKSAHAAKLSLANRVAHDMVIVSADDGATFKQGKREPAAAPARRPDRPAESLLLSHAKAFIADHYHRSLTLKEAAQALYITPGHLGALFRESGETFLQHLTSVRMHKAMELLADLRYKVYDVVEMVGYSDPSYFTEVFKKFTGQTPAEFRGMHNRSQP